MTNAETSAGFALSDQEMRLMEMGGSFLAVRTEAVNLNDLLNMRPGQIVRCTEPPSECIKQFFCDDAPVGCVAGWISEDEG